MLEYDISSDYKYDMYIPHNYTIVIANIDIGIDETLRILNEHMSNKKYLSSFFNLGYKDMIVCIPNSKFKYKDTYIKLYVNESDIDGYITNSKHIIHTINNSEAMRNIDGTLTFIRFVNDKYIKESKVTKVKKILKNLDFSNNRYRVKYENGIDKKYYDLYKDGIFLNRKLIYNINNDNTKRIDFNKIISIEKISTLYERS